LVIRNGIVRKRRSTAFDSVQRLPEIRL